MGRRLDTEEERLSLLFGPAAVWRYREAYARAGLKLPGEGVRYVSAVVRLPAEESVEPLFARQDGPLRVLGPPRELELRRAGDKPWTIPVILDLGPKTDARTLTLRGVEEIVRAHLSEAYPAFARDAAGYACLLGDPVPDVIFATPDLAAPAPPWEADAALAGEPPAAIVAVIDDGIPFAHRALRDRDGAKTRVEFCWLQGTAPVAQVPAGEWPNYGREYRRAEIDALIQARGSDEDALYREAAVANPRYAYGTTIERFGTHGSHVIATAAGDPRAEGSARTRLIAVQLPPAVTLSTTGERIHPAILHAFHYVLFRAAQIRAGYKLPDLPLIINFSYGYTGGPHDGSGKLASDIRQLIDDSGHETTLVLPAGNTFLSRLNGAIVPRGPALDAEIPWRIEANDRTASPLELWFQPGADLSALALAVVDPTGFAAAELQPGDLTVATKLFSLEDRAGLVVGRIYSPPTSTRRCITIELAPSETFGGGPRAAAGLWRIVLRSDSPEALKGPVDCRLLRDFNPLNYFRGARQSYFDPPEPLFDAKGVLRATDNPEDFLQRFGTLNDLATDAPHTIVVGSSYERAEIPAPYSSAGPADGSEPAVDCSMPAETDFVLAGRRGAGTRGRATFRLSGTSVAAPMLVAAIAEALRKGGRAPNGAPDTLGPVLAQQVNLRPRRAGDAPDQARRGRYVPIREAPGA
jgi:hypothetical protein